MNIQIKYIHVRLDTLGKKSESEIYEGKTRLKFGCIEMQIFKNGGRISCMKGRK
jgi:hypothetical protein